MARRVRRRRRVARHRSYARNFYVNRPRRRRRVRRVRRSSRRAYALNPVRRRRRGVRRVSRRRGFRRNPVLGLSAGNILGFPTKDVIKGGLALAAFPIVRNLIGRYLPTSLQSGAAGRWITNVGAGAAVGFVAGKVLGGDAKRVAMLAIGAVLVNDAINEFFPQVSQIGVGVYTGRGLGAFNTPGARPLLAARPQVGPASAFAPFDGLRLVR